MKLMQFQAMLYFKQKRQYKRVWNYKIGVLNKYSCFKIAHTTLFLEKIN